MSTLSLLYHPRMVYSSNSCKFTRWQQLAKAIENAHLMSSVLMGSFVHDLLVANVISVL